LTAAGRGDIGELFKDDLERGWETHELIAKESIAFHNEAGVGLVMRQARRTSVARE